MTRPRPPIGPAVHGPTERSDDFRRTAVRLVKRLTPQWWLTPAVLIFLVAGVGLAVIGPRILGHATDLVFNGVIGRRLPAGITKDQAVAAARAHGDQRFADLLSGMDVRPGAGVDYGAVGRTLLLALGVYLLGALLVWAQARLVNIAVQRTVTTLRSDVEDKVLRVPLSYLDSRQHGELLSRVTNDIDNVAASLSVTISQLLTSVLTVAAVLAMMLTMSPLLAVITLAAIPLSLLATRSMTRRSQRLFVRQWADTGRLNAYVEETYTGLPLVKMFGQRAHAEKRFHDINADVYRSSVGAQSLSAMVPLATMFVGNLSYVAVAVVGGLQVAAGQITLGGIQAFIQYVRQFTLPLSEVAAMYNLLQSGMASAERVFNILDAPVEIASAAKPGAAGLHHPTVEIASAAKPGAAGLHHPTVEIASAAVELSAVQGRVEFCHVDFSYRPGTPVMKDLSLVAEPGSTVAIVGPTGVGKTTLVNLLLRFYDVDSGQILIDGVDITTVSRTSLRSRIGVVLQDTWLFGGTIADNIAYGRPGAGRAEIVAAAKSAYVDRLVHTLPDGYDTWVSDDGANLSAGEKQLISIARAFLARPHLLILDEATSAVDTRTEILVQQAMRELRRGRTSFVIAHRLSTIRGADVILVMESGRIVEQGNHAQLLARRGAYYAMTQV
ncbi:ABC transporter ATP-binding protein [Mycobacterium sp. 1164966.3]|uniref:ABC transporter ATP-binding protein n=1 Tax=Mycobacterium sp. 1164966.3 TaxID=1856861 RepID=UPI000801DD0C|nr:ABC transporter ATP-binding protein [Mycobacterium sp. 1164966.3]OBA77920.1 ABC transporter ATP-binding protein [Mycobacterium sp. 1164966.3]